MRPDAVDLIRRADSARWEILRQQQVYEATLEQLESQRRQRGLGALNAGEREELDAILQELEVARQEAWQVILEGDEAISAEIALATSQAAKEEEWPVAGRAMPKFGTPFLGSFRTWPPSQPA